MFLCLFNSFSCLLFNSFSQKIGFGRASNEADEILDDIFESKNILLSDEMVENEYVQKEENDDNVYEEETGDQHFTDFTQEIGNNFFALFFVLICCF